MIRLNWSVKTSGILISLMSLIFCLNCSVNETVKPNVIQRPNILFAIADDQSYPHAGAYGFPEILSPGFDQVANNGILFTNSFAAAPQCSPSRAAILTGKNIWQLEEAGTHASSFPKKYPVFTNVLEKLGYQLGYTGKPWGPGNWKIEGWPRNPVGPEYNELELDTVMTSGINPKDYFGNFASFLETKDDAEPFFFWYGGHEPHRGYESGSGVRSGKRLEKAKLPAFLPEDDVTRNDLLDYVLEIEYFDSHLSKMLDLLQKKDQLHNTIVIVTADNGMPFPYAKANLQEYGTHVPLAISWPDRIKNHRKTDELVSLIDIAPTLLDIVGLPDSIDMTGSSMRSILFSNDNSESLRDFVLTGRERHTHARPNNLGYPSRAIRTKDFLYVKNYYPDRWPVGDPVPLSNENDDRHNVKGFKGLYPGYHDIDNSPSKSFMMERKESSEFKNAFLKRPAEQLYDIRTDPGCVKDLAGNSNYEKIKIELRDRLDQELEKQGDPRIFSSEIFDSYPRYSSMRNFEGFNERGEYNSQYKEQ